MIILLLLAFYTHVVVCSVSLVPEVSQEGLLQPYSTYADVTLFHFHVPAEVVRVTWEFAAFMDDPDCPVREVHVLVQHGSYPVITRNNATLRDYMYIHRTALHKVVTLTAYQPHDATVLPVYNPLPGSWFAAAYIPNWNEQMQQEGIIHKCRYSLGSIAMWTQKGYVKTLEVGGKQTITTRENLSYYRFYVPSHTWFLRVNVSSCQMLEQSVNRVWCVRSLTLSARSLPAYNPDNPEVANITEGTGHVFRETRPYADSYYYLLVASEGETRLDITIHTKECTTSSYNNLTPRIQEVDSTEYTISSQQEVRFVGTAAPINITLSVLEEGSIEEASRLTHDDIYKSELKDTDNSSQKETNKIKDTNRSTHEKENMSTLKKIAGLVHEKTSKIVEAEIHSSVVEKSSKSVTENTTKAAPNKENKSTNEVDWEELWPSSNETHGKPFVTSEEPWTIEPDFSSEGHHCYPILPLARIKHASDFTDTFLIQGRDWYITWLSVKRGPPLFTHLTLLPFTDIGGTLSITILLDELLMNATRQMISVLGCVRKGRAPDVVNGSLVCEEDQLTLNVSSHSRNTVEDIILIPFPEPDTWYLALQLVCYQNGQVSGCMVSQAMVSLDVRTQPCVFAGDSPCGQHGLCQEAHRGMFFFTSCVCREGWQGWGCEDGDEAQGWSNVVTGVCLLTLSNLFFLPPAVVAFRRRLFTQALLFIATMVASVLYHACDNEVVSYCVTKYEVLQFTDFFFSLLCFWVTVVGMGGIGEEYRPALHTLGVVVIAPAVQYSRTALASFTLPMAIAATIPVGHVLYQRWCKGSWPSLEPRQLLCRGAGITLALSGLIMFALLQTKDNYKYVHSCWHMVIALSLVFLLPSRQHPQLPASGQTIKPAAYLASDDAELIDVGEVTVDYTASSPVFHVTSDVDFLLTDSDGDPHMSDKDD
ncbi:hypothetical protein Pcinc_010089 [Petrolisthes cinctipes]|uniref:EGF-like domain-containing protein n=1 Tax=Petrolisthes cinctipes TaxID=88211 RepID=A0AAE1G3Q5_PETCI|nr:hypothetical protein Pcinc_010089 [Petrolisthes cinctipes]